MVKKRSLLKEENLSVVLSNLIRKYKDKKHFDFWLLLSFLAAWLFISFSGFTELASLFSNKHLGLIEALLFTQIDLISFQRSGIKILANNSWRPVSSDTFLSSFQYWYNGIYLVLWFCLLRFLVSKDFNTLILDIDLTKLSREVLQLLTKLRVAIRSGLESFILYLKKSFDESERKRTSVSNYTHAGKDAANTPVNHIKPLMDGSKLDMEAHDIHSKTENEPQHKDCPFCCEEVRYRAIKCKHCGSELEPISEPKQVKNAQSLDREDAYKKHSDEGKAKKIGIAFIAFIVIVGLFSGNEDSTSKSNNSSSSKSSFSTNKRVIEANSIICSSKAAFDRQMNALAQNDLRVFGGCYVNEYPVNGWFDDIKMFSGMCTILNSNRTSKMWVNCENVHVP